MKRLAAAFAVIVIPASISGCGLGPRNFRKITHPAPLVRARAMSLGYGQPDSVVLPALLGRLNDSDVRAGPGSGAGPGAAEEELAQALAAGPLGW